ncbi:fimbrial [Salmonella enterica subsp. enterica serovar Kintambo]|nr:fimbrial [Salmonella enterica subsp. enterica serovar Kintambo]EBX6890581.1 fimbrial [Salmonella enterica subsp. enterica serovar Kintambo]ECS5446475.1 fimbrial [Salmonella enterica subsp. enterica serovar Kintambo]
MGTTSPVWLWKSGIKHTEFNREIKTGEKTLSVFMREDVPLLLGKTKEAFDKAGRGSRAVPVIEFFDADNVPVEISWISGSQGEGIIFLPVDDATTPGRRIGKVNIYTKAFGALALTEYGYDEDARIIQTAGDNTNNAYVFNGGVMGMNSWKTKDGMDYIARMSSDTVTAQDIWQQLKNKTPLIPGSPVFSNESSFNDLLGDGFLYAGAYALGIPKGNKMDLIFDHQITDITRWKSLLTVKITYL